MLQSVGISLSGVMAPGALTAVTVTHGSRTARSGAVVALGHAVVEFPLMVALYYGFGAMMEVPVVRMVIGISGGLVLLWMGVGLIRGRSPIRTNARSGPICTSRVWEDTTVSSIIFSLCNYD